jgi:hypothetical protein
LYPGYKLSYHHRAFFFTNGICSTLKFILYFAWLAPVCLEGIKKNIFGKSVSTKLSFRLSGFCQLLVGELDEDKELFYLGFSSFENLIFCS